MDKILNCIDSYMSDIESEILKIVADQSIPLMEKNALMEPIVEQKKVLLHTKESLERIKNKEYLPKCGMSAYRQE